MIRTGDLAFTERDALQIDLIGPLVTRVRGWLAGREWVRRRGYVARHRAVPGLSTMVVTAGRVVVEPAAFPELAPIPELLQQPPLTPPTYPRYAGYETLARLSGTVREPLIRPARYVDDEVTVPDPEVLPRRLAPDWRARTGEIPVAAIGTPGELAGVL